MLSKLSLVGAAFAMGAAAIVPAAPAAAQSHREYRGDRGYDRSYDRDYRNERSYRNQSRNAYRYRQQRCENGDGGTVIGAVAGGLLGNQVAGRGNRTLGAILGGAVGAVAGRAIDRSDRPASCRRR